MPKTVKGWALRDLFFNTHSVAKYQKIEGDPLGTFKNFQKNLTKTKK